MNIWCLINHHFCGSSEDVSRSQKPWGAWWRTCQMSSICDCGKRAFPPAAHPRPKQKPTETPSPSLWMFMSSSTSDKDTLDASVEILWAGQNMGNPLCLEALQANKSEWNWHVLVLTLVPAQNYTELLQICSEYLRSAETNKSLSLRLLSILPANSHPWAASISEPFDHCNVNPLAGASAQMSSAR